MLMRRLIRRGRLSPRLLSPVYFRPVYFRLVYFRPVYFRPVYFRLVYFRLVYFRYCGLLFPIAPSSMQAKKQSELSVFEETGCWSPFERCVHVVSDVAEGFLLL